MRELRGVVELPPVLVTATRRSLGTGPDDPAAKCGTVLAGSWLAG